MNMRVMKSLVVCLLLGVTSCAFAADNKNNNSGKVLHPTYEEFNKKIVNVDKAWNYLGDKPCVIDFFATWCGPCRMISPYLDELAEEYKNEIYIYKIDVNKEPELARLFGATSIPLLVFVPMSGSPEMSRGAMSKAELKYAIETVVLKHKKSK